MSGIKTLIYKFQNGQSFSKAFAEARKAGKKQFTWNGKIYGTQLKSEVKTPSKVTINNKKETSEDIRGFKRVSRQEKDKRTGNYKKVTYYQPDGFTNYQQNYTGVPTKNGLLTREQAIKVFKANNAGGNTGVLGPEVSLLGHRTHIKNNMSGFIPVKATGTSNPVYQDYTTGEYYMVNPNTNIIIASSSDENVLKDPSLWAPYYTGYNGDENQAWGSFNNNRGARIVADDAKSRANQEANSAFHEVVNEDGNVIGHNGKISVKQNVAGQNAKKQAFANTVNAMLNYPNNAILGLGRVVFNPDYTLKNYVESLNLQNIGDGNGEKTYGFGDMFEIEDPSLRMISNFGNAYSLAGMLNEARVGTNGSKTQTYTAGEKWTVPETTSGGRVTGRNVVRNTGRSYHMGHAPRGGGEVYQNGWSVPNIGVRGTTTKAYIPEWQLQVNQPAGVTVNGNPQFIPYNSGDYNVEEPTNYVEAATPYSVEYQPGIYDPYWSQMVKDATNPIPGSVGKDVVQDNTIKVNKSNGSKNNLRSEGRTSRTTKEQKNKQKTQNADQS